MNNLYALSLTRSVQTSEGIAKVSDLLRVFLYESDAPLVSLGKEMNFIQTYFDLQRLRYHEKLRPNFSVEANPKGFRVPPTLFITFIENCFKYASANDLEPSRISILFGFDGEALSFRAGNSKLQTVSSAPKEPGGIGLANAGKRLNILCKDQYSLDILDPENSFRVILDLKSAANE